MKYGWAVIRKPASISMVRSMAETITRSGTSHQRVRGRVQATQWVPWTTLATGLWATCERPCFYVSSPGRCWESSCCSGIYSARTTTSLFPGTVDRDVRSDEPRTNNDEPDTTKSRVASTCQKATSTVDRKQRIWRPHHGGQASVCGDCARSRRCPTQLVGKRRKRREAANQTSGVQRSAATKNPLSCRWVAPPKGQAKARWTTRDYEQDVYGDGDIHAGAVCCKLEGAAGSCVAWSRGRFGHLLRRATRHHWKNMSALGD